MRSWRLNGMIGFRWFCLLDLLLPGPDLNDVDTRENVCIFRPLFAGGPSLRVSFCFLGLAMVVD